MAGFKFRLQSFLGVKEKIEEQKKLDYGKALKKLEEEKEEKRRLINIKDNAIELFKESIKTNIEPEELKRYNIYIDLMKKKIKQQDVLIEIAEKNAEKKRNELVNAMKERKMLDTLKEKDRVEYNIEQLRVEQKIIDEIVSYQYNDKA